MVQELGTTYKVLLMSPSLRTPNAWERLTAGPCLAPSVSFSAWLKAFDTPNNMYADNDTTRGGLSLSDPLLLYVDGIYRPSSDGSTFPVKDPMTGKPLYDCSAASTDDYLDAVESAHKAYASWSSTSPSARRLILLRAADILETYLEKDAPQILSHEVSATKSWTLVNIKATSGILRETAGLASHVKGEIVPADRPGTKVLVERCPVGVVFAISPWNAPVWHPPTRVAWDNMY